MPQTQAVKIAALTIDFLKSKGQLDLLPEVISLLSREAVKQGITDSAIVTSPVALSPADRQAIVAYIETHYGAGYNLVERIDSSLIAGFTIRIGDEIIDTSVASKLDTIRKELV